MHGAAEVLAFGRAPCALAMESQPSSCRRVASARMDEPLVLPTLGGSRIDGPWVEPDGMSPALPWTWGWTWMSATQVMGHEEPCCTPTRVRGGTALVPLGQQGLGSRIHRSQFHHGSLCIPGGAIKQPAFPVCLWSFWVQVRRTTHQKGMHCEFMACARVGMD